MQSLTLPLISCPKAAFEDDDKRLPHGRSILYAIAVASDGGGGGPSLVVVSGYSPLVHPP